MRASGSARTTRKRLGSQWLPSRVPATDTRRGPWSSCFHDFESILVLAIQKLIGDAACGILLGKFNCVGAVPFNADDNDNGVGQHTPDYCTYLQIVKSHKASFPVIPPSSYKPKRP